MPTQNPYNFLDGAYARMVHGTMHKFTFDPRTGFSGTSVEMLLRQYGIRVWGRELYRPDERAFLVKESQAQWAEYIMCRAGVPLTCDLIDPRNADYGENHEPGTMPLPWTEDGIGPHSIIDHIVDMMFFFVKGGKPKWPKL